MRERHGMGGHILTSKLETFYLVLLSLSEPSYNKKKLLMENGNFREKLPNFSM